MVARSVALVASLVVWCLTGQAQIPSDANIRKILASRIYRDNLGIGIVVGVVDASGRRVVAYGGLAEKDSRHPDGHTVFEIGSVTKEFTSLLLIDMARRGDVKLTDPVSKYLPRHVTMPARSGRKITLADLSTHSSGLPRMPTNFKPKDDANPYIDYSVEQLYDFLSTHQLTRDVGSQYEYSNLGVGLLGHVLSLRAGMSFEDLVRSRICDPLGLTNTRITLTPEMKQRLAIGHTETVRTSQNPYGLASVSNWDIPALPGAGALRSTVNDMLRFLAAYLGYVETPLSRAMADQISIRRPGGKDFEIAYGWRIQKKHGNTIIWHGGATGGYRSYIGFDPEARAGVIVLSNIQMSSVVDDIGPYLLNQNYPLWEGSPFDGK